MCFAGYIRYTKMWGPLRWAPKISFVKGKREEAVAMWQAEMYEKQLRDCGADMRMRRADEDGGAEWGVEA
jgi:hypothetical protein